MSRPGNLGLAVRSSTRSGRTLDSEITPQTARSQIYLENGAQGSDEANIAEGASLPTLTDGQIFTYINDGIRNTAMPAWDLPEKEVWQIVTYLRHLPPTAALGADKGAPSAHAIEAHFVGSAACESCHKEIYDRWRMTRMANVVRDPREHPDAFIPDMSKPDPVLTFTKDEVAFVYGSRWKQRYFTRKGDEFFPLPAQSDIKPRLRGPSALF